MSENHSDPSTGPRPPVVNAGPQTDPLVPLASSPTAGQRLDQAVADATTFGTHVGRRAKQEWTTRTASTPNLKWYGIGVIAIFVVLVLILIGIGRTGNGGGSNADDFKSKWGKIAPGMTPAEVQKLMGPAEDIDGMSDGSETSMEWMRDEGRYHLSFKGGMLSRKFLDTFSSKEERARRDAEKAKRSSQEN